MDCTNREHQAFNGDVPIQTLLQTDYCLNGPFSNNVTYGSASSKVKKMV